MLSPNDALKKAASTTRWAIGMCDNFVANMFGYSSSGYPTAANHWNSIPAQDKHPGDTNAPAGALVFWGGGAGHVAIADGSGGVFSTDYPTSGEVSHVAQSTITKQWGKPYLGWSLPVFQGQVGTISDAGFKIPGTGVTVPTPGGSSAVLDMITSAFNGNPKDLLERLGLIILGTLIFIVGILQFTASGAGGIAKSLKNGKDEELKEREGEPDAVEDKEEQ
jgi:hypothetical protein